jgi:threonine dehydratase
MANPERQVSVSEQLLEEIVLARRVLDRRESPVLRTELIYDKELSSEFEANIWLASEVHQSIGAYKIRGAYNFIYNLTYDQRRSGVVTVSAGNHAQGIALCSNMAGIHSDIFMPENTPPNKVDSVRELGDSHITIIPKGSDFDKSQKHAKSYSKKIGAIFASPFNDIKVIAGQATWGVEIGEALDEIDMVFCPVGGMGLIAGISTVMKHKNPKTEIIGVEPKGAASLKYARKLGKPSPLKGKIDTFVDGAAVRQVGEVPFRLANHLIRRVISVTTAELRQVTTDLRESQQQEAWLRRAELAGGLAVAGLYRTRALVKGKNVVCLISGGNLSQERYEAEVRV